MNKEEYESDCLIAFTKDYLERTGKTINALAVEIKIDRTYLSKYIGKKLKNVPETIVNALKDYFEKIGENFKADEQNIQNESVIDGQEPLHEKTGTFDKFFESTDAINITGLCSICQKYTESAIITGRSGYGKTYALRNYARKNKVCYLSCEESMTSKDLINALEKTVGLPKGEGSIYERMKGIKEFFKINEGYLLIIDEADKLASKYSMKKVEALRNLFDEENNEEDGYFGLILAGEPGLKNMIRIYQPRFANRVDSAIELNGLSSDEIRRYLSDFEISESALQELIYRGTNSQTGCFRLLNRTIKKILRFTEAKNTARINDNDIKTASSMMML